MSGFICLAENIGGLNWKLRLAIIPDSDESWPAISLVTIMRWKRERTAIDWTQGRK